MTRKLKALGLALVAVFAMSALAASAAHAEFPAQLTAEPGTTVVHGESEKTVTLTRTGKDVQCTLTLSGPASNGATTLTSTPVYSGCSAPGIGPATVTMNGCHFEFTLTVDIVFGAHTYTAITHLICPVGKEVELHVYTSHENHTLNLQVCTYNFPAQKNLATIDLTNEAALPPATPKNWIRAHINIQKITSVRKSGSALLCGAEHDSAGVLEGTAKFKGKDAGTNITGITISTK